MNNNKTTYKISDLSPHLFWDTDSSKVTWNKHPHFLVERILEYGLDKDWQILLANFGVLKIVKYAKELRSLDNIALHFIALISDTPINEFRCYKHRQLVPHYSGY